MGWFSSKIPVRRAVQRPSYINRAGIAMRKTKNTMNRRVQGVIQEAAQRVGGVNKKKTRTSMNKERATQNYNANVKREELRYENQVKKVAQNFNSDKKQNRNAKASNRNAYMTRVVNGIYNKQKSLSSTNMNRISKVYGTVYGEQKLKNLQKKHKQGEYNVIKIRKSEHQMLEDRKIKLQELKIAYNNQVKKVAQNFNSVKKQNKASSRNAYMTRVVNGIYNKQKSLSSININRISKVYGTVYGEQTLNNLQKKHKQGEYNVIKIRKSGHQMLEDKENKLQELKIAYNSKIAQMNTK